MAAPSSKRKRGAYKAYLKKPSVQIPEATIRLSSKRRKTYSNDEFPYFDPASPMQFSTHDTGIDRQHLVDNDNDVTDHDEDSAPVDDQHDVTHHEEDSAPVDDQHDVTHHEEDSAPVDDQHDVTHHEEDSAPVDDQHDVTHHEEDSAPVDDQHDVTHHEEDSAPVDDQHDVTDHDEDSAPVDDQHDVTHHEEDSAPVDDHHDVTHHEEDSAPVDDQHDVTHHEEDSAPVDDQHDVTHHEEDSAPVDDQHDVSHHEEDSAPVDDTEERDSSEIEESTSDENFKTDNDSSPLYQGSRVTLAQSMLLLMMLVLKHGLTNEAVVDIILVLELHCLAPNLLKCTLAQFKDFFNKFKDNICFQYYCNHCETFFGDKTKVPDQCFVCLKDVPSPGWFISMPISQQVKELLKDEDARNSILNYRHVRRQYPGTVCDIMDGKLYKECFDDDVFIRGSPMTNRREDLHISFQLNTDGVSIFHSSTFGLWPVYLLINELDPKLRMQRKYSIFAGLWFGYKKPEFKTFLQPFAKELRTLFESGFDVGQNGIKRVRCILLCASFDAPAKCQFMEMTQFNGYYGCPCCLSPGESVATSQRGRTHVYPYNNGTETGHGELRSHRNTILNGKQADETLQKVNGFKGTTWFMFVPKFDFIRGISIDYMHQLLLGVTKQLFGLWYSKDASLPYTISNTASILDERITKIKPPNKITRVPRKMTEHYSKLKASEWRSFLLFYSIPCMFGLLPPVYFNHFLLLVHAAHILLGTQIHERDIERARRLLKEFCSQMSQLYGKRHESFNIHMLLHLPQKVMDLGPLWTTSLFYFEDLNGELRKFIRGTQRVEVQIIHSICVLQKMPSLIKDLCPGTEVSNVAGRIQRGQERYNIKGEISPGIKIVGSCVPSKISKEVKDAIISTTGKQPDTRITKFKRLYHFGTILHSKSYLSASKRNSYTVAYEFNQSEEFGEVDYFIKSKFICENPNVCNMRCACREEYYSAIVSIFQPDVAFSMDVTNVVKVHRTQRLRCVPVGNISELCIIVENENGLFLSRFPNQVEKD